VSICGRSTGTEDLDGYSDEEEDEFAAGIEKLYEKRATTRESGLQKLTRLLTSEWQLDDCTFKQETLKRLFLGCFKRGGALEAALSARALGEFISVSARILSGHRIMFAMTLNSFFLVQDFM